MFFTLKKRCAFCGSALNKDGHCPNADCINHEEEKKARQQKSPTGDL